jgi:hypothetical protein
MIIVIVITILQGLKVITVRTENVMIMVITPLQDM